jgi:hypothetical protein
MRAFGFVFAVFLWLLPTGIFAQQPPSDAEINAAIAKLGESTGGEGFGKFEVLYKNPRRATELVIASLRPVRRGQYLSGNHPQVV